MFPHCHFWQTNSHKYKIKYLLVNNNNKKKLISENLTNFRYVACLIVSKQLLDQLYVHTHLSFEFDHQLRSIRRRRQQCAVYLVEMAYISNHYVE